MKVEKQQRQNMFGTIWLLTDTLIVSQSDNITFFFKMYK